MREQVREEDKSRLLRVVDLLGKPPGGRMNRIFLFGALALFIAGSVIAFSRLEIQIGDIHWAYLLAISVLALPSLIASAVEYRVSGLIAGKKVAFADALRVSLYATAANILPPPCRSCSTGAIVAL